MVLLMKHLMKSVRMIEACFMLIAREAQEKRPIKWSRAIKRLLEEYVDVTPEELPIGFLPDRGIDHHIDLILGSNFPN